jgi:hypothetical protein
MWKLQALTLTANIHKNSLEIYHGPKQKVETLQFPE